MPPVTPITQPEQVLEDQLVAQLIGQGYTRAAVTDEATILANLKAQLEAFNGLSLTAGEFTKVLNHLTKSSGVFEKAKILRDRMKLTKEDGTTVYLEFFDSVNPLRNRYQVTQQVAMDSGTYKNRYDVTILVNGLPLVQIELKRRGLEMKEAFNQIQRYQKHSYWSAQGLFHFVQLFVISNGVNTKYYANARKQSFKQTFYWASEDNKTIRELPAFTTAFLNREHLGGMIGKYTVLNETDKILIVLRAYQFYAAVEIAERVIHPPEVDPNGYVWHTTGSGKTLTSFIAAQIITGLPSVYKVVFCVDRKDLDYQTIKEFNGFSKGSVDSTNNTSKLVQQFTDDTKLIVTTLQKLNTAISKPQYLAQMEKLRDERIIFIFDECHRSQFGDTHQRITAFFRNHQMFGFTGTPIFAENSSSKDGKKHTTKDLFHKKLHSYVITDAIKDENVLKFAVEYVGRYRRKAGTATEVDIEVEGIDTKELMESPARLEKITDYIIEHHPVKTRNKEFTAMMCVSSVDVLIKYYELFAKRKAEGKHKLKIATIFSYTSNEEDKDADGILDEGGEIIGGEGGNPHTREKLDGFISDYNGMFATNFSTKDTQSFYNYYQDIAKKVKERKVDILLVVNMFLTGFDSKSLNTMYVDKDLKYHGLVQAYSRTNRIINEVKSQGNIVVFRNLKKRTDEAIALFSNVHAKEEIFVPPYDEYVAASNAVVLELLTLTPTVKSVKDLKDLKDLKDEEAELKFVKIFRELMRLRNILESFSEFDDEDLTLPAQRFADYRSAYLDLYDKVKTDNSKDKASILADVDFELELIHRDVINVQYVLTLLAKLYDADETEQAGIRKLILDSVAGDLELRSKRELIEKFIEQNLPKLDSSAEIPDSFEDFWEKERVAAFDRLVKEEQLDADKLKQVIDRYVYTGQEPLPDPDIVDLIQKPLGILERGPTRKRVLEKVVDFVATFIRGVAA
jgi:type I restriction enzyme R subunit